MSPLNWKLSVDGLSASRVLENGFVESRLISALDEDELAGAIEADLPSLSQVQDAQLALLATAYSAAIQQPVAYLDTSFQADEASQIVLTKVLVVGAVQEGFFWLDANNQPVPMTFAQLQCLAAAMLAQGQAAFGKLQQLKSAVREATTVDAVAAVAWQ